MLVLGNVHEFEDVRILERAHGGIGLRIRQATKTSEDSQSALGS